MTQPDIEVAVQYALAQAGKEYRAWDPDRWWEDYSDCSSLVVKSWRRAGIVVPDNVRNTVGIYHYAKNIGALISVQKGVETRGAVLVRGRWWGYGPIGHASFSLGDGRQMAARGRRSGIGISTIDASFYHDAVILPNVNYHLGPAPLPAPPPAVQIKEHDMIVLPGVARPESRGYRSAAVAPNGQAVFLMNGGKVLGMADVHADDPKERRRWYPKNADGSPAATPDLPLIGLSKDSKYLIALRLDGGMYRGEIDAS